MGQAGLYITLKDGTTLAVDPYLSDSLYEKKDKRFIRNIPIEETWLSACPDIILITHDHGDHLDMETMRLWLAEKQEKQILGPEPVFRALRKAWPKEHNIFTMRPGVSVTFEDLYVKAISAAHETIYAVGYLIKAEEKCIYITGDTLYTEDILKQLSGEKIDLMFSCINGVGNNMNVIDAARLVNALRPKNVVPVHWDMFKSLGANPEEFVRKIETGITAKIINAYESLEL